MDVQKELRKVHLELDNSVDSLFSAYQSYHSITPKNRGERLKKYNLGITLFKISKKEIPRSNIMRATHIYEEAKELFKEYKDTQYPKEIVDEMSTAYIKKGFTQQATNIRKEFEKISSQYL